MSVKVRIPTQLRTLTEGREQVEASGSTVAEVIQDLEGRFPGVGTRLLDDEGRLRRFINVYVSSEDVRFLKGLETEVAEEAELSIIPAVAGGS